MKALCLALCLFLSLPAFAQRAAPDEPYLQESAERIVTARPVTAAAFWNGAPHIVIDGRIRRVEGTAAVDAPGAPEGVRRLKSIGEALWAMTDDGLFRIGLSGWKKVDSRKFVDLCLHLGKLHAATRDAVYRLENGRLVDIQPKGGWLSTNTTFLKEDGTQIIADPIALGPIRRIASYAGTLYLLRDEGLALLDGATFAEDPYDWGQLPSQELRDMAAQGNRLWISTDRWLGLLRGANLAALRGPEGLPVEETTCVTPGFEDDLWIGTARGAVRKVGSEWQYFGAQNWLPADRVNAIAVEGHDVCIATDGGVTLLHYEPCTLRKKAAYFEREMEEWGFKRLGFVNSLVWAGEKEGWIRGIGDNDGGNLSRYLAAMTFKYAVTSEEKARAEAVEAFNAMAWLQTITGRPGLIARSVWSVKGDKGERANRGSGGLPAKWVPTPDGNFLWKGDTSSDEVNAHFYAVSLFHDLAAKGAEKDRARDHLGRLAGHILEHGWKLIDADGQPTRWGRWDPKYLLTPYGFDSIGLNGMEAQTYMTTALALTGDPKFQKGLDALLKLKYHTYTVRQKLTFPPDSVVPWDDRLAFYCYSPLLRYAKDPTLRSIYLRSIERTWELLRGQRYPFFNFLYGAATGNDCDSGQAAAQLRAFPLDLVNWSYHNSHRADLAARKPGAEDPPGGWGLSSRETGSHWDSGTPMRPDGGGSGRSVAPPSEWLQEYWMGRYYGFIAAPKTGDPALTTVAPRPFRRKGAAPYAGPTRP